jgi:hypothetical protein
MVDGRGIEPLTSALRTAPNGADISLAQANIADPNVADGTMPPDRMNTQVSAQSRNTNGHKTVTRTSVDNDGFLVLVVLTYSPEQENKKHGDLRSKALGSVSRFLLYPQKTGDAAGDPARTSRRNRV